MLYLPFSTEPNPTFRGKVLLFGSAVGSSREALATDCGRLTKALQPSALCGFSEVWNPGRTTVMQYNNGAVTT
jgi:hypothetical protein